MLANLYFFWTGFGGSAKPIPPTALIWGDIPDWAKRGKRRSRFDIPEEVIEAIEAIAQPVEPPPQGKSDVYYRKLVEQQRLQRELALREELKRLKIAWRKIYLEALLEFYAQQDDDFAILLLMMEL